MNSTAASIRKCLLQKRFEYDPTGLHRLFRDTIFTPIRNLPRRPLKIQTILAMNAFPSGTRVFYWGANGEINYGTVQSTSRMADGTQILVIKEDSGKNTTLPAAGVSKVS